MTMDRTEELGRLLKRACKCAGTTPDTCVDDDEVLSRSNKFGAWLFEPTDSELDVSVVRGEMDGRAVFLEMTGREPSAHEGESLLARHATAGTLREAGFAVVHTPGRRSRTRPHVSIVFPKDWPMTDLRPWPQEARDDLGRCFT